MSIRKIVYFECKAEQQIHTPQWLVRIRTEDSLGQRVGVESIVTEQELRESKNADAMIDILFDEAKRGFKECIRENNKTQTEKDAEVFAIGFANAKRRKRED